MKQPEKIRELIEKAEKGDPEAQFNLGKLYEAEAYDSHDPLEAVYWLKNAAEQGYASAQYEMGSILLKGLFLKRDHEMGIKWLRQAADQKHLKSMLELAEIYSFGSLMYGNDIQKDFGLANFYYEQLYELLDDVETHYRIGRFYTDHAGEHVDVDKVNAVKWYTKAAKNGHVDSQYDLGNIFLNGDGVSCDVVESIHWLKKSANSDHLESCLKLAEIFNSGGIIKCDLTKVIHWHKKAALLEDEESSSYNFLVHVYFQSHFERLLPSVELKKLESFIVSHAYEKDIFAELDYKFSVKYLKVPIEFSSKKHASHFYYELTRWDCEENACLELASVHPETTSN